MPLSHILHSSEVLLGNSQLEQVHSVYRNTTASDWRCSRESKKVTQQADSHVVIWIPVQKEIYRYKASGMSRQEYLGNVLWGRRFVLGVAGRHRRQRRVCALLRFDLNIGRSTAHKHIRLTTHQYCLSLTHLYVLGSFTHGVSSLFEIRLWFCIRL